MELAASLGVARSVLREALSRLKMMGMIETRTRRGMVLTEPSILGGMRRVVDPRILSEDALFDILGFRIALEIGICHEIFLHITPEDIAELEEIVNVGIMYENNEYAPFSEFAFHTKLYKITGNRTIAEFQNIVHPVMTFVKEKFREYLAPINVKLKEEGRIITHQDLLRHLKEHDEEHYREALEQHFEVYKIFIREKNNRSVEKRQNRYL
jgi:DNA-binding FadR family transcriptional regulator